MQWRIGSRALTVGGKFPVLNAGHLVLVVAYNPNIFDRYGQACSFQILRIDGHPFAVTANMDTGHQKWGKDTIVWVKRENLHFLDDLIPDAEWGYEAPQPFDWERSYGKETQERIDRITATESTLQSRREVCHG